MAGVRRPDLTEGQIDCLRLVGQNYTSKEIARQLGISSFAVDQRLTIARRKLCATSRSDAARRFSEMAKVYEPFVYDPQTLEKPVRAGQPEATQNEWEVQEQQDLVTEFEVGAVAIDANIEERSGLLSWVVPPPFGGEKHSLSNGDVLLKSINIAFISTIMVAAVIVVLTGVMRLFP